MTLKTFIDTGFMETTDTITPGEWNTIYVVYASTASGYGVSKIYINGVDNNGEAANSNSLDATMFTSNDIIQIGQGLVGELRRFRVYSPAPFGLATEQSINFSLFFLKNISRPLFGKFMFSRNGIFQPSSLPRSSM